MRAEEFRTGNLILRIGNLHDVDWGTIKLCAQRNKQFNEDFKPIPLSTEWLERLGFRSDLKDWYWIETVKHQYLAVNPHGVYLSNTDPDDSTRHADEFSVKLDIKYMHSLQNLFHSLTGQELILKP